MIYLCKMLFRMLSSATHPKKRKNYARRLQVSGGLIIAWGIFFSHTLSNIPPTVAFSIFSIGIGLGLLLLYLANKALNRLLYIPQSLYFKPSEVEGWVNSWTRVNEIPKILPPPNEETTSVAVSPDIAAYSFDRVVVCDNNSIAQMLIANNFHFENNCAVLSITGYPQNIFNTVMQMLRLNPNLKVYALHDASPEGVSLLHRLGSSPNWFANSNVPIYDLGLFPRHVFASKSMLVRQSPEFAETARQLPDPVRQSLSKDEIKWLEMGNYVELEFFTPQKLLQVVTQGIARSREPGRDNGMISIYGDGDDDNRSTSAMIFASESFG
ncbi:MAG: MFS transporter permease [Hormoscilla sp. GUM202]|nr:MFS transporter permease [Hormoscilla sp. GUM202]